eukprot:gb/GECH01010689.1/.p1 GENE.gb/GECH01010689.1/~~gb/GECH01010689.1/.p1  ORF type:complete len:336 (+),score=75.61 gb/GECH01010689.1/:1-1008(+)
MFCEKLPKIEVHAHLGGSIRDSTMIELVRQSEQFEEDDVDQVMRMVHLQEGEQRSLNECFKLFDVIHSITNDLSVIERVAQEVCDDFKAENCRYLELRSTPRNVGNASKRDYIETVLKVLQRNESPEFMTGYLVTINRAQSKEEAIENVRLAMEYQDQGVCGIEMSGNPYKGNFNDFIEPLNLARSKSGLPISLHFAERQDEEEALAMLNFKPDRIGHGCFLTQKSEAVMLQQRVPLEICISSNVLTQSVSSAQDHHFGELWKQHQYPMIICTDDRGVFGTSLTREYQIAQRNFGLTDHDLFDLSMSAIDSVFASDAVKDRLKAQFCEEKQYLLA